MDKNVNVTILCENTTAFPFKAIGEWGFSAFLKTDSGNFLFDTGQGLGLINNAKIFGIKLESVQSVIISHGHFDHTGGLKPFLQEVSSPKEIIAHPDIFSERFTNLTSTSPQNLIPIHPELTEEEYTNLGAKFRYVTDFYKINDSLSVTGQVPRKTDFELPESNLVIKKGEEIIPDPFYDDMSLVVQTSKGTSIILGCAHSGLINILNYTAQKMNVDSFHAIIGGTHLFAADQNRMNKTINALHKYKIEKIGVSHCTGLEKASILQQEFGDKFFHCNVGVSVEI